MVWGGCSGPGSGLAALGRCWFKLGGEFFFEAEHQQCHILRVKAGDDGRCLVRFGGQDMGCLKDLVIAGDEGDDVLLKGSLKGGLQYLGKDQPHDEVGVGGVLRSGNGEVNPN